ncbi:MAG: nucleotide pyrophosphohydrolase [Deltaproteobacteria bacterium]|nr:nucleotide pyrophosphohydrolase [Deltaproteobacteria bacterium]
MNDPLQPLIDSLRQFADERNWQQFHSPKNLACALSVEAAELLEHFQWLSEAESRTLTEHKLVAVREELADVFIYLLQLADKLGVDLVAAAESKLAANRAKYPVEKAASSSKKYTEF